MITNSSLAITLIGAVLLFLTFQYYFLAAFTDPGYLPRSTPSETINLEYENGKQEISSNNKFLTNRQRK